MHEFFTLYAEPFSSLYSRPSALHEVNAPLGSYVTPRSITNIDDIVTAYASPLRPGPPISMR